VERRKHDRLALRVPVFVEVEGVVFQKMVRIEAQNISTGGLFFETHHEIPLQADSRVMLHRLGDLPDSAQIRARVVHCHRDPRTGLFSVGLQFVEFQGVGPGEVMTRLKAWQAAQKPGSSGTP
jgi:c-di-GMP-binding flagellar brake protein YcgR